MIKKCILLLLIFIPQLLQSQTITSINIHGLKRTKKETLLQIIKIEEGDEWSSSMEESIVQRLRQSGIFQTDISLKTEETEAGMVLELDVKDKWTMLGFPFYSISQGESTAGGFLLDSNAFGRQHTILATLLYSKGDISFFSFYSIPRIKGSIFNLSNALLFYEKETTITDITGKNLFYSFKENTLGISTSVNSQWKDHWGLSFSISALYHRGENIENTQLEAGEHWAFPIKLSYSWKNIYTYPIFSQGISLSADSEMNWTAEALTIKQTAAIDLSWVPVPGLNIKAYGYGLIMHGPPSSYYLLGTSKGSKTLLDNQNAASAMAATELSTEIRLFHFSFGNITLPLFYEAGLYSDFEDTIQAYHGAGGGFRFYLEKVALPAMGLEYHYSFSGAGNNLKFSIGASF